MLNAKRLVSVTALLAAALLLAVASGCKGFFVNQPNSVSVSPTTLTVTQGGTGALTATATYNSGTKDVTSSAGWTSSSPCATVSAGVVKGIGAASGVTITANVGGITGTATVTVTGSQGLVIAPANNTFTLSTTPSAQFTATQNGADVTNSATWSSGNSSIVTFSSATPGLATFSTAGTTTVTASLVSGSTCASGTTNVTVQ